MSFPQILEQLRQAHKSEVHVFQTQVFELQGELKRLRAEYNTAELTISELHGFRREVVDLKGELEKLRADYNTAEETISKMVTRELEGSESHTCHQNNQLLSEAVCTTERIQSPEGSAHAIETSRASSIENGRSSAISNVRDSGRGSVFTGRGSIFGAKVSWAQNISYYTKEFLQNQRDEARRDEARDSYDSNSNAVVGQLSGRCCYILRRCIAYMLASRFYEPLMLLIILLNAMYIGWEVEYHAVYRVQFNNVAAELFFVGCFTMDLVMRLFAESIVVFFCRSKDIAWNIFDFVVVLFSLVEVVILSNGAEANSQVSVVRLFRIARVLKAVRIIKFLRFFRELRMLVYNVAISLKSLIWTSIVFCMVFFMFSIVLVDGVTDHLDTNDTWDSDLTQVLRDKFGGLGPCVLSLFEATAGGVSWGEFVDILWSVHPSYVAVFLIYISFAVFALVNTVTAFFVEATVQSSILDTENMIAEDRKKKKRLLGKLEAIFTDIDVDNDGCLSVQEFSEKYSDKDVSSLFHALGIEYADARAVYECLDKDFTGKVSIEKFLDGCMHIQGSARALDMAIVTHKCEFLKRQIDSMVGVILEWRAESRMKRMNI